MFCEKCGAQLPEGSNVCSNCGAVVSNEFVSQEVTSEQSAFTPQEVIKPVKKSHAILVVLSVIGVLLVGLSVAGLLVFNSPKATVYRALKGSESQFEKVYGKTKTFSKMMKNAEEIAEKKKFTVDVTAENTSKYDYAKGNDKSKSSKINVKASYDKKGKKLGTEINFENDDKKIQGYIYADNKKAVASMPDVLDENYSIVLDNLGEKIFDSELGDLIEDALGQDSKESLEKLDVNLFADVSLDAFKKECPDDWKEFKKSLVIKKTDKDISNADDDLKVYSVEADTKDLTKVIKAYVVFSTEAYLGEGVLDEIENFYDELDEALESIEDFEVEILLGIRKGCLTAINVGVSLDGDDKEFTVVLEGDKNIWDDFTVYVDDEKALTGAFKGDKNGFEFVVEVDDEEFVIECKDSSKEINFTMDDEEVTIKYDAKDKGVQLSIENSSSYEYEGDSYSIYQFDSYTYKETNNYSINITPNVKIKEPKKPIDILTLDEDDFEKIAEYIYD